MQADGLPTPLCHGRNLLFFTWRRRQAPARAGCAGGRHVETDYSGYPDCRDNAEGAAGGAESGRGRAFDAGDALMWLDKAATWRWRRIWAARRW